MFLLRMARRIWFRAAVFTLVAVAIALLAGLVGPLFPDALEVDLGQGSVVTILQVLASSMLAVTTFSLTAMVTAYGSAASVATPRATQLLVEDRTSQNALSSFLGTFVFAIVGLIALSTGYYGSQGRTILFLATLAVVVFIVVSLLRWISHLSGFGRMADVIERVEASAATTLGYWARQPHLGAAPPVTVPAAAVAVHPNDVGYVTFVDIPALAALAHERELVVHVAICPGATTELTAPVAWVEGDLRDAREAVQDAVRGAFRVERNRTYEQDPRLGVIALAEIGSRALSPAVNDPGTAVQIIAALSRVFTGVLTAAPPEKPSTDRVHAPSPAFADLLEDAFRPLARDGAGMVEVGLRLQRCFRGLIAVADTERGDELRSAAVDARERAEQALSAPSDLARLREAAV